MNSFDWFLIDFDLILIDFDKVFIDLWWFLLIFIDFWWISTGVFLIFDSFDLILIEFDRFFVDFDLILIDFDLIFIDIYWFWLNFDWIWLIFDRFWLCFHWLFNYFWLNFFSAQTISRPSCRFGWSRDRISWRRISRFSTARRTRRAPSACRRRTRATGVSTGTAALTTRPRTAAMMSSSPAST